MLSALGFLLTMGSCPCSMSFCAVVGPIAKQGRLLKPPFCVMLITELGLIKAKPSMHCKFKFSEGIRFYILRLPLTLYLLF